MFARKGGAQIVQSRGRAKYLFEGVPADAMSKLQLEKNKNKRERNQRIGDKTARRMLLDIRRTSRRIRCGRFCLTRRINATPRKIKTCRWTQATKKKVVKRVLVQKHATVNGDVSTASNDEPILLLFTRAHVQAACFAVAVSLQRPS